MISIPTDHYLKVIVFCSLIGIGFFYTKMEAEQERYNKDIYNIVDGLGVHTQLKYYNAEADYLRFFLAQKYNLSGGYTDTPIINPHGQINALKYQVAFIDTTKELLLKRLSEKLNRLAELESKVLFHPVNPIVVKVYSHILYRNLFLFFVALFIILGFIWTLTLSKISSENSKLQNRKLLMEINKLEKEIKTDQE